MGRQVERLTQEDRHRLQRILAELSDHQATADVLRQQTALLSASLSELAVTVETVKTIGELKPDTEILVPIGSNSFITAKVAVIDKVITGLGAGVAAERAVGDAIQVLETRAAEVGKALGQTQTQLERLAERIDALRPEAERILAKAREK